MKYDRLTIIISGVWFTNGLLCKVLNQVPRHEQIIFEILSIDNPRPITCIIGLLEIIMGIWVFSKAKPRHNAIVQIFIVAIMNTLEFMLVPHLLLWGRYNALFALLFILLVYYNGFHLNEKQHDQIYT